MTEGRVHPVLRHIRKLVASGGAPTADRELLDRFTAGHDEVAFEALLERYGPLVWGVCRRLLPGVQDAEDAFQATFVVFVRKAATLRQGERVGAWLYGVAYRVAVRARANAARRRSEERQVPTMSPGDPLEELAWRELRPILDEEVRRLPAKYRVPFILCYLEGKTNEQAAQDLGCPKGTVLSRLARARERLRVRLTRRGLALSAGILTTLLVQQTAPAAVPPSLGAATLRAGVQVAAGKAADLLSTQVITLAEGVWRSMYLIRLTTALLLVLALLGAGVGVLHYHGAIPEAAAADEPKKDPAQQPAARTDGKDDEFVDVACSREGIVLVIGIDIKDGEKMPPGRITTVKVGEVLKKYRVLKKGDAVVTGQLLARLDDRLAREEVGILHAKVTAAVADQTAAEKTRDEAKHRWDTAQKLLKSGQGGMSEEDLRGAKLTYERYFFEAISKGGATDVASRELRKGQIILETYEIRSPVNGVIQAIYKRPGEGARSLEPIMRIRVAKEE